MHENLKIHNLDDLNISYAQSYDDFVYENKIKDAIRKVRNIKDDIEDRIDNTKKGFKRFAHVTTHPISTFQKYMLKLAKRSDPEVQFDKVGNKLDMKFDPERNYDRYVGTKLERGVEKNLKRGEILTRHWIKKTYKKGKNKNKVNVKKLKDSLVEFLVKRDVERRVARGIATDLFSIL